MVIFFIVLIGIHTEIFMDEKIGYLDLLQNNSVGRGGMGGSINKTRLCIS